MKDVTEDDEEESGYVCVGPDFSWVVRGGLAEDGAPSWDGGSAGPGCGLGQMLHVEGQPRAGSGWNWFEKPQEAWAAGGE